MIPIRANMNSPITTVGGVRAPLREDHPMAGELCPVCDGPLTAEAITFVLVGFDPEVRAEEKEWATGAGVVVHARCAGAEEEK